MTELKPILFNTEMVRAILEGRKSVTRRLILPSQMNGIAPDKCPNHTPEEFVREKPFLFKPYCKMTDEILVETVFRSRYQKGDILYVRETWRMDDKYGYVYYATDLHKFGEEFVRQFKWKPSIHMPREATRLWLQVTDVTARRIRDITEEEAKQEGATDNRGLNHSPDDEYNSVHTAREHFARIWNATIPKEDLDRYGFEANPWVWVISFKKIRWIKKED